MKMTNKKFHITLVLSVLSIFFFSFSSRSQNFSSVSNSIYSIPRLSPLQESDFSKKSPATNVSVSTPFDEQLRKIMEKDEDAQAEADKWILEYRDLNRTNAVEDATLPVRILDLFSSVQIAYEEYLFSHGDSLEGQLAYASFLADIGKENDAVTVWLAQAKKYPENPVLWNNIANHYAQAEYPEKSFDYYEKAIQLAPMEPLYLSNLATVVYVFRDESMKHYQLSEQQVLRFAQSLYRKAYFLKKNFVLATQIAQTWYFIEPFRYDMAMTDWKKAYLLASDDAEREGVLLHFARVNVIARKFTEAEGYLENVKYPAHQQVVTELREEISRKK